MNLGAKVRELTEVGVLEIPKDIMREYLGLPGDASADKALIELGVKIDGEAYVLPIPPAEEDWYYAK